MEVEVENIKVTLKLKIRVNRHFALFYASILPEKKIRAN